MEIKVLVMLCLAVNVLSVLSLPVVPKSSLHPEKHARNLPEVSHRDARRKQQVQHFTVVNYADDQAGDLRPSYPKSYSGIHKTVLTHAQFVDTRSHVHTSHKLSKSSKSSKRPPRQHVQIEHNSAINSRPSTRESSQGNFVHFKSFSHISARESQIVQDKHTADGNSIQGINQESAITQLDNVGHSVSGVDGQNLNVVKGDRQSGLDPTSTDAVSVEYQVESDHSRTLQLAVSGQSPDSGQASQVLVTVSSAVVAVCALSLLLGVFSCCCPRKADREEKVNGETAELKETKTDNDQSGQQVGNISDLPEGEKDLDETLTFKDRLKALDQKLILQPSPNQRRSQLLSDKEKRKSQADRLSKHSIGDLDKPPGVDGANIQPSDPPRVLVSEESGPQSGSGGDTVSKSDTQDDISDKIFDNVSMHSSVSQPYNPDVVIADSDEEEDFSEIQRGTSILKSFQRAKPPRNRSPATRTSKGKIRKARPGTPNRSTAGSTSASPSVSIATGDSLDRSKASKDVKVTDTDNSPPRKLSNANDEATNKTEPKSKPDTQTIQMTKSSDFSDFDSVMNASCTSIGSDIVTPSKRNGKYAKHKQSPKPKRPESPAKALKSKEGEVTQSDKGSRTDSPSRVKTNNESPVQKRKKKSRDQDSSPARRLSSNVKDNSAETRDNSSSTSPVHRLSGIPAGASGNIFYLIDPTVKNKCKSVGDITEDSTSSSKSRDFNKDAQRGGKLKTGDKQANPSQDQVNKLMSKSVY